MFTKLLSQIVQRQLIKSGKPADITNHCGNLLREKIVLSNQPNTNRRRHNVQPYWKVLSREKKQNKNGKLISNEHDFLQQTRRGGLNVLRNHIHYTYAVL